MSEIERYNRKIRKVYRDDINIIDHISFMMVGEYTRHYCSEVKKRIPLSNDRSRLVPPKCTVAYSITPIKGFPKIEVDEDFFYHLPDEDIIKVDFDTEKGYDIITDNFKHNHLVLYLKGDVFYDSFNKYKERGASWYLGEYSPLILVESFTSYTKDDIKDLPLLEGEYFFNVVRYRRFAENMQEISENDIDSIDD